MDKSFIKDRYAKIRIAHNLSARKLSIELGQSTEYINQIESGNNLPSMESFLNFCDYFKITPAEFFDGRIEFPVECKGIIEELNKMDSIAINQIYDLLKLINNKKQ